MAEFMSAFGGKISAFPDDRTARGYKRETWLAPFIKLDRWLLETHPEQTELTRELAHGWMDDETASDAKSKRLSDVRSVSVRNGGRTRMRRLRNTRPSRARRLRISSSTPN